MVHLMTGMRQWLEQHGLGKYAKLLAENEVDFEVLPELEETDLERIGLASRPISTMRCNWPGVKRRNPSSCELRSVLPALPMSVVLDTTPSSYSHQFTTRSLKASTPPTSRKRRPCSKSCDDYAIPASTRPRAVFVPGTLAIAEAIF